MQQRKIIRAATIDWSIDFFRDVMKLMREKGYDMIALTSPGEYLTQLKTEYGFRIIELPMERHISILKDIKSLIDLVTVFRREKPLVVHSITPKAGLLCMLAARLSRVPIRIHTFTGLVWPTSTGVKRKLLMLTDKITCFCATHIIPEGEGVKNDLQAYITSKPMRVLGYGNVLGVDMDFWDPLRINVQKDERVFQFLFTGRIVGDKGINELVWAFVKLQKIYPSIRLMLTGSFERELDPLLPEIDKEIVSNDAIVVNGPFFGDDLVRLYALADCFVMPSYREGFPNSVLEAGAMGLPQIVTDINGSREIIRNEINGLIVPAKDREALFQAMRRIYEDCSLREIISFHAREMISSRFERSFVQRCQIDFYNEILEGTNV